MYQSDMTVVTNPTEEAKEFMKAIDVYIELFHKLSVSIPFYKVYNNKLSRDFTKAAAVSFLHVKLTYICRH